MGEIPLKITLQKSPLQKKRGDGTFKIVFRIVFMILCDLDIVYQNYPLVKEKGNISIFAIFDFDNNCYKKTHLIHDIKIQFFRHKNIIL